MEEPKLCVSCKKRPVAGKRRDAVYCIDPKCRKEAHLKRKELAAQVPPVLSANKSSLIVTFPDGRRCLIELTLLESVAPTPLPTLVQVPNTPTENNSGSILSQEEGARVLGPSSQIHSDQIQSTEQSTALAVTATQNHSDQIQRPGTASRLSPLPSQAAEPAQTSHMSTVTSPDIGNAAAAPTLATGSAGEPSREPRLRTVELYFLDESGRQLSLPDAVRLRGDRAWRMRPHAKAALGTSEQEGYGLGGEPGSWPVHFPAQAPSHFGLDADIGVVCKDSGTGGIWATVPTILRDILGSDWRAQVRSAADRTSSTLRR